MSDRTVREAVERTIAEGLIWGDLLRPEVVSTELIERIESIARALEHRGLTTPTVGSGEDEARERSMGQRVVGITERCHPSEGDQLVVEFDSGALLVINAERLHLSWRLRPRPEMSGREVTITVPGIERLEVREDGQEEQAADPDAGSGAEA